MYYVILINGMISVEKDTHLTIKEYNDIICFHITKSLENKFGAAFIHALNSYLKRFSLTIYDMCLQPDTIRSVLYSMFGNASYKTEYEIVKDIYELFGLTLMSIINLSHAMKMTNTYYKLIKNKSDHISDILELVNIEYASMNCKCCDRSIDLKTNYNGIISELCDKCYELYEGEIYR